MSGSGAEYDGPAYSEVISGVPVYHHTSVEDIDDIVDEGLVPSSPATREYLETNLEDTAVEHGISLPVTRQNCVFFYPSFDQVLYISFPDAEYPPSLMGHKGIVVVDATSVESPLYLGDFQLFGEAIALRTKPEPDHMMVATSVTDALRRYAASFKRVESLAELKEATAEYHFPEVVVEGGVSSDAVREVIFRKSLHTGGLPRPAPES